MKIQMADSWRKTSILSQLQDTAEKTPRASVLFRIRNTDIVTTACDLQHLAARHVTQ
jgi:hypothetical protein